MHRRIDSHGCRAPALTDGSASGGLAIVFVVSFGAALGVLALRGLEGFPAYVIALAAAILVTAAAGHFILRLSDGVAAVASKAVMPSSLRVASAIRAARPSSSARAGRS
jgi:hypothetical protein